MQCFILFYLSFFLCIITTTTNSSITYAHHHPTCNPSKPSSLSFTYFFTTRCHLSPLSPVCPTALEDPPNSCTHPPMSSFMHNLSSLRYVRCALPPSRSHHWDTPRPWPPPSLRHHPASLIVQLRRHPNKCLRPPLVQSVLCATLTPMWLKFYGKGVWFMDFSLCCF